MCTWVYAVFSKIVFCPYHWQSQPVRLKTKLNWVFFKFCVLSVTCTLYSCSLIVILDVLRSSELAALHFLSSKYISFLLMFLSTYHANIESLFKKHNILYAQTNKYYDYKSVNMHDKHILTF